MYMPIVVLAVIIVCLAYIHSRTVDCEATGGILVKGVYVLKCVGGH